MYSRECNNQYTGVVTNIPETVTCIAESVVTSIPETVRCIAESVAICFSPFIQELYVTLLCVLKYFSPKMKTVGG